MGIILSQEFRCRKLSKHQEVSVPLSDILTVPEGESILLRTAEVGRGNTHWETRTHSPLPHVPSSLPPPPPRSCLLLLRCPATTEEKRVSKLPRYHRGVPFRVPAMRHRWPQGQSTQPTRCHTEYITERLTEVSRWLKADLWFQQRVRPFQL